MDEMIVAFKELGIEINRTEAKNLLQRYVGTKRANI